MAVLPRRVLRVWGDPEARADVSPRQPGVRGDRAGLGLHAKARALAGRPQPRPHGADRRRDRCDVAAAGCHILPTTGRPREGANRIKCASNLKQIGLALQIYSQDNGKRYPPTLDEVLVECDITSEVFCCPSGNDDRAIGPTTQALLQDFHKPGHNSYVYVAGNQPDRTFTDTYVLAYEQPANHANKGMNILYGDGHVDWVTQAEATRVVAELQAGFNPPRPPATIGPLATTINAEFGVAEHVDHCVGSLENFRRHTKDCHNIETRQGASPYDFKDWTDPLDLVFLDGVHHNPVFWDDLNFWFWKLRPGGVACGDDCARTHPDVLWGVHDFAKNHGLTFFVKGRIWVMARPPCKDAISAMFRGV